MPTLLLDEACGLLNEGVSKGNWKTEGAASSYTNSYATGFAQGIAGGSHRGNSYNDAWTNTRISTNTEWKDNPWYISKVKLKDYAFAGVIPLIKNKTDQIAFDYQDIIDLRTDTHSI